MMARMLTAVVTRGTGRAAAVAGHAVAGKTGTTQDYRDAWFIGWIDGEIIGVWLGNDDDRPMKAVQGGGAAGSAVPRHCDGGEVGEGVGKAQGQAAAMARKWG